MQLRAHVSVLVRKRELNQPRAVLVADPRGWPLHLRLAWEILHSDLVVPTQTARILISRSLKAANECAVRMNERAQQAEECERSNKVEKAFARLFLCAKRAPAKLRHLLDEKISSVLQSDHVDVETIEALLQASRAAFEELPDSEPAQTALLAMDIYREHGYDTIGLTVDFSSLSPLVQEDCKSALSLAVKNGTVDGAEVVFKVLADGITPLARPPRGASDIVIDYVATVASIWRSQGLRPARAWSETGYRSRFHRFCDLVLTALVEPDSRRHEKDLVNVSTKAWARQRQLPAEYRKFVRGGLRRKDTQWLVTHHCLREGLRRRFKKPASRLHMT